MRFRLHSVPFKKITFHATPRRLANAADAMPLDHACEEDSRIGLARSILFALAWLDAHWIGDLIGSISLFVLLFGGLFMGCGLGLK